MEREAKIFIAGHTGLVGSAIERKLRAKGFSNLLLQSSSELDLRDQSATRASFAKERPEYVILAAAKVGGIGANSRYPAKFIYDNLAIETNVIHEAYKHDVKNLLFIGSSCIYPKHCPQPIKEEYLLSGALEPTNKAYAVAKIAGIVMCESYNREYKTSFLPIMPCNLYGPGDNFNVETSHVLASLLRKFHEAKRDSAPAVVVWGTGRPLREFMHVDDLADASIHLLQNTTETALTNVGTGHEITIAELAEMIRDIVGYSGAITLDDSKPDGTPRKLLDCAKLTGLGWTSRIGLQEGIAATYEWYLEHEQPGVSA